jgi:predicted dehydrogenase
MYYFFGEVEKASGIATNQGHNYKADDLVMANILFKNNIAFSGAWCFNAPLQAAVDQCEIIGTKGKICFSVFSGNTISVFVNNKTTTLEFEELQHVQQPMIEATVKYFLDELDNPCSGFEGAEVMRLIEAFVD